MQQCDRLQSRDASTDLPGIAADILARLRAGAPRVHCITNTVAQNFTANVLLAVGAVPSMTIAADEVADFVASAQGLLVNLGTIDPASRTAIGIAVDAAVQRHVPWVLDPVFVDRVPARLAFARALIRRGPSVMRLNAREFQALAGMPAEPDAIREFAQASGTLVAVSGRVDHVYDGTGGVALSNGHPLMAAVTAAGCAASALVAACLAVEPDATKAALAALSVFGIAGEVAGGAANGPGSFAVGLIDALHRIDGEILRERMRAS